MSERILIRGANWIGDAVMSMPAITALAKSSPDAGISLLVKPWVAGLFENNPFIEEILLYDESYRGISGRFRLAGDLKKKRFSRAVLFQNALDAALIARLAGIPERVGYDRDYRGLLLTNSIAFNKENDRKIHPLDYFLGIIRAMGLKADYSEPWIYLLMEERLKARKNLRNMKRPIIGINPGAYGSSARRWPAERFAEVAARITGELEGSVVVFGGEAEKEASGKIFAAYGGFSGKKDGLSSMVGKTTIRELAASISECDVFLSNDSGPMHMAMAIKTPVVGLFGPVDPSLRLFGKGNVAIKKDVKCSPCFLKQCSENEIKCLLEITAEEVFDSIKSLIPTKRAVFFDRDGTLCVDADYLNNWGDFKPFDDIDCVRGLKEKGFMLIGVTNQSGIARGIIKEQFAQDVNDYFVKNHGFDNFYYCPHHPEEHCPCRKPEPEMLYRARAEHRIDLKSSYVVGDNEKDLLLAKAVGAKAVLVMTGKHKESANADFIAGSLSKAAGWIIKDGENHR